MMPFRWCVLLCMQSTAKRTHTHSHSHILCCVHMITRASSTPSIDILCRLWWCGLHGCTHQKQHISIAPVIESKNEQNCSLIHMMKYNPLDGNCICLVLTFFVHTCMQRVLAAWIAFNVCLFSFAISMYDSVCVSGSEYRVHKFVLNLLSGWQRRLCNHQPAAAFDAWVLRFNIGSRTAPVEATPETTTIFFNQII